MESRDEGKMRVEELMRVRTLSFHSLRHCVSAVLENLIQSCIQGDCTTYQPMCLSVRGIEAVSRKIDYV